MVDMVPLLINAAKVKRGGDLCENVTYLGQQGVYVMPK